MASIIKVDTIQDQDGNNIINENANTITIGKSGDTVQVAAGAEFVGGGIQWQSDIKTSAFTAVAGEGYWINTTSAAVTVTLPASASVGDTIEFTDYARNWNTNNLTLNTNSLNYQGNTSPNPVYNVDGQHVRIVYSGATQGWIPTVDDDVTLGTPQAYSIDFLVVAGGGGGGTDNSGGAGGGGMRTSTQSATPGVTITCTVGAGGNGATSGVSSGNSGSDSSISGTGLTTITSTGGGYGAYGNNPGDDGGAGGGAGTGSASGGSGNTPSTTPSQGADGGQGISAAPSYGGGGGGGGGASGTTGANATSTTAGDGGDGTQSSITGSATYYAGGGGAAGDQVGIEGTGGLGGGGDGLHSPSGSPTACDATDGLGGGGGAHYVALNPANPRAGNGGSGVVILSVPTANYSGTTTGSPTITTSGSNTILTFTGSGSYTV